MTWVLLLMKMVSVDQKLSRRANRVNNKVVILRNEITEEKAKML
jgi:hypothetical protein